MKCRKSRLVWIILSIIILLTGMCSEIGKTHSSLVTFQQAAESETIEDIKNDTLYIGNCTNKLITGLRDTFQKIRRNPGRISFRNYAEFLWIKEILQMLSFVCIAALFVCQPTERSRAAILEFIHNQDGEK